MNEKQIIKHHYNQKIMIFGSIFLLLIILLFSLQWYFLNKKINDYKTEKDEEINNLSQIKSFKFLQFDSLQNKDGIIVMKEKDILKINEDIRAISDLIYKESNRAESIIDKDLDRLNLYMSMGIGFIAIIGVFIPILVNLLSVQDLREKINDMPSQAEIKEFGEKANSAMEKSKSIEGISASIGVLQEKVDKAIPTISTLILQNAIGRFFNISPYILTNLIREKDRNYFINLLDYIRIGFNECKNDFNHSISSDKYLNGTINDFCQYLKDPKSHSSSFSKEITDEFFKLYSILKLFLKQSNKEKENDNYEKIDKKFIQIIELIRNGNNKTQSAA